MRIHLVWLLLCLISPLNAIDHLIPLPLTRQSNDYTCGASLTTSILGYYGETYYESDVALLLGTNSDYGTDRREMVRFFVENNFNVVAHDWMTLDELRAFLDEGTPVVCLIQAWWDQKDYSDYWDIGHYVAAIGYDEENLYFLDPWVLGNYCYIPVDEFESRWHQLSHDNLHIIHWGMAVSKENPAFDPAAILPIK